MKLRHLIGIFAFLTSFAVSVLLVGSQNSTFSRTKCFDRTRTKTQTSSLPSPSFKYTETQIRIQDFLEKDRQTGIELSREKVEFSDYGGAYAGENSATMNLVRKMKLVECDGLPANFCTAWDKHRNAWEQMSKFLSRPDLSPDNKFYYKFYDVREKERQQLNSEINRTYDAMLDAARRHGVDFRY